MQNSRLFEGFVAECMMNSILHFISSSTYGGRYEIVNHCGKHSSACAGWELLLLAAGRCMFELVCCIPAGQSNTYAISGRSVAFYNSDKQVGLV